MFRVCFIFLALILTSGPAAAQEETRAELIARLQVEKARVLQPEVPPKSERVIRRARDLFSAGPNEVAPTFGGVRFGSGFAAGVLWHLPAGSGQLKNRALLSMKDTRRVDSTLRLPLGPRGVATAEAFWEDATQAAWFGYGMGSAPDAVTDPVRSRGAAGRVEWSLGGPVRISGGAGYLHVDTDALGGSNWAGQSVGLSFDTRSAPSYTRQGSLLALGVDRVGAQEARYRTFNRLTADARHFVPLLHEHWIVALQLRAELTDAAANTPYVLLPALGGGSSLRGYPSYRFIDRQSVLGRAELRWTAAPSLDLAMFLDRGAVAHDLRKLQLSSGATGWGFGARFHGEAVTGFRIELARGREGWHLHLSQQTSF